MGQQLPFGPPPAPGHPRSFFSVNLTALGTSLKWNPAAFVLSRLAYFTPHGVLNVHPRCGVSAFPSSLGLTNIPLHVHTILFICAFVDGHLGCFHLLTIVNNAARNVALLSVLFFLHPEMELQYFMYGLLTVCTSQAL